MPFRFNCEQCDVRIKVPDGSQGKKVRCPGCGHSQQVPGQRAAAAPVVIKSTPKARQPVAATGATPPKEISKPQRQVKQQATPADDEQRDEAAEQDTTYEQETELQTNAAEEADVVTVSDAAQEAPEETLEADRALVRESARDLDALHAFLSGGADAAGQASADVEETDDSGDEDEDEADEIVQALKAEASDADVAVAGDEVEDKPQVNLASSDTDSAVASTSSDEAGNMQATPVHVDSESGEAPAGEVRDLFDDYVKREELERIAAEEAKAKQAAAEKAAARAQSQRQSRAAKPAQAAPTQPPRGEPVVVTKAPVRINRPVQASTQNAASAAPVQTNDQSGSTATASQIAPVASVAAPAVREDDPSVTQALAAVAQAAQAPQSSRAAQAIPLSGSQATTAPQRVAQVAAAPQESPAIPQAEPAMARVRKPAGPIPAYTLLLVLCWSLRVLACLSLVSVVKLLLIWSDNGATTMDMLITLPLGLGLCAGIWAIGEVARVTRDAARANHH